MFERIAVPEVAGRRPAKLPHLGKDASDTRICGADETEIGKNGRGERIRTSDPLVPNQVLYQAEPLPELVTGKCSRAKRFLAGSSENARELPLSVPEDAGAEAPE